MPLWQSLKFSFVNGKGQKWTIEISLTWASLKMDGYDEFDFLSHKKHKLHTSHRSSTKGVEGIVDSLNIN
ncbi:hypothetical protein Tco_0432841 [Tanacetum coccineum]